MINEGGNFHLNSLEEIIRHWKQYDWEKNLKKSLVKTVELVEEQNRSVLKIHVKRQVFGSWFMTDGKEHYPVVLKIYKLPLKENHSLEINMYKNAY